MNWRLIFLTLILGTAVFGGINAQTPSNQGNNPGNDHHPQSSQN